MIRKLASILMLFAIAAIWGFAIIAQVLGSDHLEPFSFNGIRFLMGAVSLIPVYHLFEKEKNLTRYDRKKRHKRTAIGALFGGCFLFVAAGLQQFGTAMTRDPGKAGFITGLYTVLTPVLYFFIFRKKSGLNIWLGCILSTIGLYLLCFREGEGFHFGVGELLLLLGALFWAGHILLVGHFVDGVSPLRFSSWQFFVCGALGIFAAMLLEDLTWEGVWAAKWALLYCGLLSVGVAYTLQVFAQKRMNPAHAAIIFSTESVFSAIGGILWNLIAPESLHMDQKILPIGYLGCLIIFVGIVLSQLNFKKKQA